MRKLLGAVTAAAFLTCAAGDADAAVIVLDFEGVGDQVAVNNFYNGGTDGAGNSGTNYGVVFSSTSLGLRDSDAGGTGNFANEPSPSTVLFFQSGGEATLNFAAGFDLGFSFFYASSNETGGLINVYEGLNGTGNLLASLALPINGGGCSGDPNGVPYCNWTNIGVAFSGIARSVDFGGTANQIAFDNITLGSVTAGSGGNAVPEPGTWAMMLVGFGGIGFTLRRRRAHGSLLHTA